MVLIMHNTDPVWFVHLRRKESRRAALSIPSVDWGIPALMLLLYIFQQHKLLACATLLPRAFCLVIENGGNSNTSLPVSNWHILQLPWIWDQCQTDPQKPQFGAYWHDWKLLKKHLHLSAIKTKTTTTTKYSKHAKVNNIWENLHIFMQIRFR